MVCDAEEELPQISVAVQVLVTVNLLGQLPGIVTSATVTVAVPPQLLVTTTELMLAAGIAETQL